MQDERIALVTGANQGVGFQVAKALVTNGVTVLVGSRNFERGEAVAKEIGPGAFALQLDDGRREYQGCSVRYSCRPARVPSARLGAFHPYRFYRGSKDCPESSWILRHRGGCARNFRRTEAGSGR
jgi:hypothetical protein